MHRNGGCEVDVCTYEENDLGRHSVKVSMVSYLIFQFKKMFFNF